MQSLPPAISDLSAQPYICQEKVDHIELSAIHKSRERFQKRNIDSNRMDDKNYLNFESTITFPSRVKKSIFTSSIYK